MPGDYAVVEVNGGQADQAVMSLLEHEGWGHFTAMQVRGGRTRGLGLHLARLETAHHDMYGRALGGQDVRARIRLAGITMLVLQHQLAAAGIEQAEEPVRVQDLTRYHGMILCNSLGWAPVSRVDHLTIVQDETFTGVITAAMDNCPWDEI